MLNKKVSVIIPIYNVEEYLPKCLDSAISQTYKNLEIICVNDCSPDNCGEILKEYAKNDSRIKIVNREQNGGLSAARNTGLDIAKGKYIYFLDSDDWIDSDYIEKMVKAIEYSQTDFVVNLNAVGEKNGVFVKNLYNRDYLNLSDNGFLNSKSIADSEPWSACINLYKKSFIDKYNLKFPEGYINEDVFFHYITYLNTDKLYVFEGAYYHYTIRESSITKSSTGIAPLKMSNYIYEHFNGQDLFKKTNLKIFIPPSIIVNNERDYIFAKSFFVKIKEDILSKKDRYSKFELFVAESFLGTKDFKEYRQKYKIIDVRVQYVRARTLSKFKEEDILKKQIPIFLSSDNNYAPFVATTIASICDNTKSFIDFYVLDGGISVDNKAKIESLKSQFYNFSIEFIAIDTDKYFNGFLSKAHFSKSMYSRFLIPELKPEINKAIYSDVDVIVLGDIVELYDEDLEGYTIGAAWEEFAEQETNGKRSPYLNLSDEHKFFASGNLLIDCKKWREDNITRKLLEIEEKYRDSLRFPDQDILNKCFDNNYKLLPSKYCYVTQNFNFYKEHNVLVRHFNTELKPWHFHETLNTELLKNISQFWYYAKMTPFYNQLLENCKVKDVKDLLLLIRAKKKQPQLV